MKASATPCLRCGIPFNLHLNVKKVNGHHARLCADGRSVMITRSIRSSQSFSEDEVQVLGMFVDVATKSQTIPLAVMRNKSFKSVARKIWVMRNRIKTLKAQVVEDAKPK